MYFRTPNQKSANNEGAFYENQAIEVQLWKNGIPTWKEHPTGSLIDLVAIEIPTFKAQIHCVNDKAQYESWVEAGQDCFIVGYPEGLGGSEGTPIWKRGSIASEPNLPFQRQPVFLCDSSTREGMSGSPVFAKMIGNFSNEGRPFTPETSPQFFGFWTVFLGVFGGREGVDELGFNLSRVWNSSLIKELVSNHVKAECPFIQKS